MFFIKTLTCLDKAIKNVYTVTPAASLVFMNSLHLTDSSVSNVAYVS